MIKTDENEDLDRSISGFTLEKIEDSSMTINVNFTNPLDVSKRVIEPDSLDIKITMPQLIKDKETGDELEVEETYFIFKLIRQFTPLSYVKAVAGALAMKKAIIGYTIGQMILLFFIGKAISSMFDLWLTLQYLVYIG